MGALERARQALALARAGGTQGAQLGGQALLAAKKKIKERPTALRTMRDAGYTAVGGATLAGGYLLKNKFDRELDEEEERKMAPIQKEGALAGIYGSEEFEKLARKRRIPKLSVPKAPVPKASVPKASLPKASPQMTALGNTALPTSVSSKLDGLAAQGQAVIGNPNATPYARSTMARLGASAPSVAATAPSVAATAPSVAATAPSVAATAPSVAAAAPSVAASSPSPVSPAGAALAQRQSTPMALAQGSVTSPGGVAAEAPSMVRRYGIDPTMGGIAQPSAQGGVSPAAPAFNVGGGAGALAQARPGAPDVSPSAPASRRPKPTSNPRREARPQAEAKTPTSLESVNQRPRTHRQMRADQAAAKSNSGEAGGWEPVKPTGKQKGGGGDSIDPRLIAGGAVALGGAGLLGAHMLTRGGRPQQQVPPQQQQQQQQAPYPYQPPIQQGG